MTRPFSRIAAAVSRRAGIMRDRLAVAAAFRHLHGPARVTLRDDQAALVTLVRDAEWFLHPFLSHHQALGVAHVVLVDNGSTDATVDIARGFAGVTVLRNTLPARRHEVALRARAAARVLRGGWVLFADADEMAELPLGDLPGLLRYANAQGHTAILGQMIDLFAPGPYAAQAGMAYDRAVDACRFWSADALERIAYHDATRIGFHWFLRDNICDDPGVMFLQGGLRSEVFGETPFLSKHSLVRNVPGVDLMTHPHAASRVRLSDTTIALRHYKLAGPWRERDRRSVAAATWDHAEDARRLLAARDDDFRIAPARPLAWRGAGDLLERGILHASARARAALSDG
ncbi:MAG: glycosyltransferase family 2 protein [Paracoccaceae bacterium]|nr:MAG: glycosyltransferase family 2 protein [Paracoccaceae bacterium]